MRSRSSGSTHSASLGWSKRTGAPKLKKVTIYGQGTKGWKIWTNALGVVTQRTLGYEARFEVPASEHCVALWGSVSQAPNGRKWTEPNVRSEYSFVLLKSCK